MASGNHEPNTDFSFNVVMFPQDEFDCNSSEKFNLPFLDIDNINIDDYLTQAEMAAVEAEDQKPSIIGEFVDFPEETLNQHALQVYDHQIYRDLPKTVSSSTNDRLIGDVNVTPCNDDLDGEYNFNISMKQPTTNKINSWVFSEPLNKVFITMNSSLPINFTCNWARDDLYVRAMPVFTLPQFAQQPVVRCLTHSNNGDPSNIDQPSAIYKHVVRCTDNKSQYFGSDNQRYSVRTPLKQPQAGSNYVTLLYRFMCKNSCSSGMNRKPIEIIFTLEDASGLVYGRRKFGVRICSCPKRDKEKEEASVLPPESKKRRIVSAAHIEIPSKKRLMTKSEVSVDDKIHKLEINIPGSHNYAKIVEYIYDVISGDARRNNTWTNQHQTALDQIAVLMKKPSDVSVDRSNSA